MNKSDSDIPTGYVSVIEGTFWDSKHTQAETGSVYFIKNLHSSSHISDIKQQKCCF